MWQKKSFPLFFIDKCVKTFLDKLFIKRKKVEDSSTKKKIAVSLEFLGKIPLQVKRQLIKIFRTCHKDINLNFVLTLSCRQPLSYRNQSIGLLKSIDWFLYDNGLRHEKVKVTVRMSNAFRFKDQIPKCLNSMLLYKFTWNTCNSVYIGKTKRHFLVRQLEHLGLSAFTNKALRCIDTDAIAISKHCRHQNHVNRTDNFEIMGNSVNSYFLQLKELLLILKLKPSLNVSKESLPLYLFDNDF